MKFLYVYRETIHRKETNFKKLKGNKKRKNNEFSYFSLYLSKVYIRFNRNLYIFQIVTHINNLFIRDKINFIYTRTQNKKKILNKKVFFFICDTMKIKKENKKKYEM